MTKKQEAISLSSPNRDKIISGVLKLKVDQHHGNLDVSIIVADKKSGHKYLLTTTGATKIEKPESHENGCIPVETRILEYHVSLGEPTDTTRRTRRG